MTRRQKPFGAPASKTGPAVATTVAATATSKVELRKDHSYSHGANRSGFVVGQTVVHGDMLYTIEQVDSHTTPQKLTLKSIETGVVLTGINITYCYLSVIGAGATVKYQTGKAHYTVCYVKEEGKSSFPYRISSKSSPNNEYSVRRRDILVVYE